jgi:hypothetical protein
MLEKTSRPQEGTGNDRRMSVIDEIEKELKEISPWPWDRGIGNEARVLFTKHHDQLGTLASSSNSTFIAKCPERIAALVEYVKANEDYLGKVIRVPNMQMGDAGEFIRAEHRLTTARAKLRY